MNEENKRVSKEYPLAWKFMIDNRILSPDWSLLANYVHSDRGYTYATATMAGRYAYAKQCYAITPSSENISEPVLSMMEFFIKNKDYLTFTNTEELCAVKDDINNMEYLMEHMSIRTWSEGLFTTSKPWKFIGEWGTEEETTLLGLVFKDIYFKNQDIIKEKRRLEKEQATLQKRQALKDIYCTKEKL